MNIDAKKIFFFGVPLLLVCDGNCAKAWGINLRPKNALSLDEDDYEYLADGELGIAPADPGSYEGGHGKPSSPAGKNKWCARECERSKMIEDSLPNFTVRVSNKPAPAIPADAAGKGKIK